MRAYSLREILASPGLMTRLLGLYALSVAFTVAMAVAGYDAITNQPIPPMVQWMIAYVLGLGGYAVPLGHGIVLKNGDKTTEQERG